MRLFVAVHFEQKIKADVCDAASSLKGLLPSARWVPPENVHLTLKFLGEVSQDKLRDLLDIIKRCAEGFEPFEVPVIGLGVFPEKGFPRVLWVGLEDLDGKFAKMASILDEALSAFAEREKRPFVPHITVARLKGASDARSLQVEIEKLQGRKFGTQRVDSISLMESKLSPSGAVYSVVERIDFRKSLT